MRRVTKEDNVLSHLSTATDGSVVTGSPIAPNPAEPSSEVLLERILASLDDDKAEDVISITLRGKSEIADYMVVASGRSTRQVSAMAEKLVDRLKAEFGRLSKIEGKDAGDWVLIDTGDVIVHLFRPEVREFYQLEKMWQSSGSSQASS